MRILNFYLVNENTVRMVPFVAENGNVYTFVIETAHTAIVSKSPSIVIEESKRFYMQRPKRFYLERKWASIGEIRGKSVHANFRLTLKHN